MSEWWTYHLSDFLMFSPRTYYRLFELYNAAIWPAQVATVLLGLAIMALLRQAEISHGRRAAAILAGCWLFVAIDFHLLRYATINWGAVYFAAAFGLEALLLIWIGLIRGRLAFQQGPGLPTRSGFWIFLFALVLQPLIGPLVGRPWRQVEIFGVAPDPTAAATLGLLMLVVGRVRWELMVIPLLWCAISGVTLVAMKSPGAWVLPAVGALVLLLSIARARTLRRRLSTQLAVMRPGEERAQKGSEDLL